LNWNDRQINVLNCMEVVCCLPVTCCFKLYDEKDNRLRVLEELFFILRTHVWFLEAFMLDHPIHICII